MRRVLFLSFILNRRFKSIVGLQHQIFTKLVTVPQKVRVKYLSDLHLTACIPKSSFKVHKPVQISVYIS